MAHTLSLGVYGILFLRFNDHSIKAELNIPESKYTSKPIYIKSMNIANKIFLSPAVPFFLLDTLQSSLPLQCGRECIIHAACAVSAAGYVVYTIHDIIHVLSVLNQ